MVKFVAKQILSLDLIYRARFIQQSWITNCAKLSFDKFDVMVIQFYGWYNSKLCNDFNLACYVYYISNDIITLIQPNNSTRVLKKRHSLKTIKQIYSI